MKKDSILIISVIAAVIFVIAIGAFIFAGMFGAVFSTTEPPILEEVSVAVDLVGGYDAESGVFVIEGSAQNMGKATAYNCRVEVTFFNVDTQEDLRNELVIIGDVTAESSKDINLSIPMADGSHLISFRMGTPTWD